MKVPKIRFSGFTDAWEQRKLGEWCEFINGDRSSNYPSATEFVESGVPFVGSDALGTTLIDKTKLRYITSDKYKQMNGLKIKINDILYTLRGAGFGKCAIADFSDGTIASSLVGIRCNDNLRAKFLIQWLNSSNAENEKNKAVNGSTAQNISVEDMKKYNLSVPSLDEQERISDYLYYIDNLITLHQRELSNLDTQKKAVMKKIFSQEVRFKRANGSEFPEWEEKVFTDVAQLINGRAYSANEMLESGKYMILRVGNLFSNNEYYYSDMELDDDKYINEGDLIYAWSATFGPRIYHGEKCIYHYHIWKVIPYSVEKDYFLHFLYADVDNLQSELNGGTMKHITKEIMEKRFVPLPCKDEQRLIADFLSDFDEAIAAAKKELELWKELKKGLLQQMFV